MNDRTESRVSSVSDADIAWRDRARAVLPGGVSTNVRLLDGPQIFIVERARGCRVWDVAGTEYIDYVCGFGSILLGHADPRVNEAVQDALTRGQQFGATHPLEIRLAEQLCATVPRLELVRYSSSGSEAVHAAMRLARATVAGSGELARQSSESAAALREAVTSPGGTTRAALDVLMARDGLEPLLIKAVAAATRRSRELAD